MTLWSSQDFSNHGDGPIMNKPNLSPEQMKGLAQGFIKAKHMELASDPEAKAQLAKDDPEPYRRLFPTPEEKRAAEERFAQQNSAGYKFLMKYRAL
jgi:hypothetical protein